VSSFNRHKNENTPTITNILDELWNIINSTLPTEKPNNTVDRLIVPFRKVMEGILYILRTKDACGRRLLQNLVLAQPATDDFKNGFN